MFCSQVFGIKTVLDIYRRHWLLSIGAYSFCQQENEHLTANMRLTANMHLIGITLITMGGVIIINGSGVQYFGILRVKRITKYTIKPTAK